MTRGNDKLERSGQQDFTILHRRIHACALPRLSALVRQTLDAVDDALFDMAEKASSNAEQARYFDGMREVRRRRGDIEHRFQERVVQGLVEFSEGRARSNVEARRTPESPDGLSLVDNEDLEQSLAVTATVARAEGKLGRVLFALNQRLGVLASTAGSIDDDNNPLAPAALASAFRSAIEPLDCTLETRLVLFKLFDRLVVDALDPVYEEVNRLLVDAGILPRLPSARSQRQATAEPSAAPADQGAAGPSVAAEADGSRPTQQAHPAAIPFAAPQPPWSQSLGDADSDTAAAEDSDRDSPFADETYRNIYTLMAARRTARQFAAQPSANDADSEADQAANATAVEIGDLLLALSALQSELDRTESQPTDPDGVKHRLIERVVQGRGSDRRSSISPRDEHSIDLVGMVFDYILQDPNLPAPIQVLLARLQIPYVKVALLDPRFFAMRSHPARRLLDELSQAGVGWSEASDPDRRLYERIGQVVDTVLRDFEDNLALFDRLLANFRSFIASERRRAEIAEQRAAEATRGRERLLGARRRAAREVLERVRGRDLPRVVHTILTRPWANFLVLTLLRQGEESPAWRDALRFADDLVWSTELRDDPKERQQLAAKRSQMERMLRHGLATVAYHDSDIEVLCDELNFMLESQINPDAPLERHAGESETELHLPDEPLVQPLDSSLEESAALRAGDLGSAEIDASWLQQARDLRVGTWVEFQRSEESPERGRLSWTSPVSGRHLFVNHKGLKICDRSPEQLASELAGGLVKVIESSALVDRALSEILARLRKQPVAS